ASPIKLVAAGIQDHFAVLDFSVGYSVLASVLDHVSSQRFSDYRQLPVQQTGGNSVAVEHHVAQLHAARVGSRWRYDRDTSVQIPITQTKCFLKWNVQSLQRNGELRLQSGVIDANRGRAARFPIGRDQRIDVCGGQFRSGSLVSACSL